MGNSSARAIPSFHLDSLLVSSNLCLCTLLSHLQKGRVRQSRELMANNNPADNISRRGGAELADRIAARIPRLHSLEGHLIQAIECTGVPANTTRAKILFIYKLLKIIKMGGQDMEPRFRLGTDLIAVALGGVKCSMLMYILLGDMPWLIVVLCVLMAFAFILN